MKYILSIIGVVAIIFVISYVSSQKVIDTKDNHYSLNTKAENKKPAKLDPKKFPDEWLKLRNNETAYRGTSVTWCFKVCGIIGENLFAYLGPNIGEKPILVIGRGDYTYQASTLMGYLPRVREEDWLVVTAIFCGVSSSGMIVLQPTEVTNIGYIE